MAAFDSSTMESDSVHNTTYYQDSDPEMAHPNESKKRVPTNSASAEMNTLAIEDMPSDTEIPVGEKPKSRMRRAWDKRSCVGGCRAIPFWSFVVALTTLCLCAIIIPTVYMGMGPTLAQESVSATCITLHNIRVSNWAFNQKNASDPCEIYHPETLTVTQDILFSDIPWYGHLGPTWIYPSVLDLSYNGTKFAELYMPRIDLTDVQDGQKWSNDTVCTMLVTNDEVFLKANEDIVPLANLKRQWTIWHQEADVILQQNLLGITSYYPARMSQDVNVSNVDFLDGPINLDNLAVNFFTAIGCVGI